MDLLCLYAEIAEDKTKAFLSLDFTAHVYRQASMTEAQHSSIRVDKIRSIVGVEGVR